MTALRVLRLWSRVVGCGTERCDGYGIEVLALLLEPRRGPEGPTRRFCSVCRRPGEAVAMPEDAKPVITEFRR